MLTPLHECISIDLGATVYRHFELKKHCFRQVLPTIAESAQLEKVLCCLRRVPAALSSFSQPTHAEHSLSLLEWPAGADRLQRTEVRGSHAA